LELILDFCNNHCGNEDILLQMLKTAYDNQVNFVKFQLYNPEKLNPDYPGCQDYKRYLEKCKITEYFLKLIEDKCNTYAIHPIFTIFTPDVLINLKNFNALYSLKIASPDMLNYKLIDAVVKSKSKVWISTGMHTKIEITKTIDRYKKQAKFMYCISRYPTEESDINYSEMLTFDGFSDHTLGIIAAQKAFIKGVQFVEKHFTLSKYLPGRDHHMSMTPDELEKLMIWVKYKNSIEIYKKRWVE